MSKTKAEQELDLVEWFIHLAEHDRPMVLRLMLVRQMIEHRGITLKELGRSIGSSPKWIGLVLLGKAYYEPGSPDTWKKQDKAYAFIDRIEEGITFITDQRGGLCCASSRKDMAQFLSVSDETREQFRGRIDRT